MPAFAAATICVAPFLRMSMYRRTCRSVIRCLASVCPPLKRRGTLDNNYQPAIEIVVRRRCESTSHTRGPGISRERLSEFFS